MTKKQKKLLVRILAAAALMIGLQFVPVSGPLRFALYLAPYLIAGHDILRKAAKGIWNRQLFDENFLMAVATVGALVQGAAVTGDYAEAVAVMVFYQLGELFQAVAVGKSRRSIAALMDIRPDSADLLVEGVPTPTDPEQVPVGSLIRVAPGQRVPLDGTVTEGAASLDTAALTGESLPRQAAVGSEVVSGCIVLDGVLTVRTTRVYGESTVARVLELVENASSRKSRSEAFITRFARWYTPAVCLLALLLALAPPLVLTAMGLAPAWGSWAYRALTFLVISCPCALVISIPLGFFAGLGGAGRAGVLIKGSNWLEALAAVDCVVLDKTGTLTRGEFAVQAVHGAALAQQELLRLAAHAESGSSHPIGRSIRAAFGGRIDHAAVSDIREHSGHGVTALVDGRAVAAGSAALMAGLGAACPACDDGAGTVVHIAVDGDYAGHLVIADSPKPTAAAAIAALHAAGVKRTVMLTGDAAPVANAVAAAVGVDEVHAQLLPQDKVTHVEALLGKTPGKLAFVGDGVNDAPVLARADVGIAMGALGADAAIEAADVVLMDDDPAKLALAIRHAKRCMAIVRQNIVFSLAVKLGCLVLGALGLANMWLAIFADVGVMVLAVLNAIRALRVK